MKLDNIEWLFFDVGSTLVSEEKPLKMRNCFRSHKNQNGMKYKVDLQK